MEAVRSLGQWRGEVTTKKGQIKLGRKAEFPMDFCMQEARNMLVEQMNEPTTTWSKMSFPGGSSSQSHSTILATTVPWLLRIHHRLYHQGGEEPLPPKLGLHKRKVTGQGPSNIMICRELYICYLIYSSVRNQ